MRALSGVGFCLLASGYAWCIPALAVGDWWLSAALVAGLMAATLAVAWPTPGYVLVQALVFATFGVTFVVEAAGAMEWAVAGGVALALGVATAAAAFSRPRAAGLALVSAGLVNAIWIWTNGAEPGSRAIVPANVLMTLGLAAAGAATMGVGPRAGIDLASADAPSSQK
ncbi:MAG TPA: hypothetical protein VM327_03265 [Candidatus Thermoplasmatota archaeon]|nr:hypothetical protein [Candidatus Thermoplasmatota archaeon]